jgi:hypothetical protein
MDNKEIKQTIFETISWTNAQQINDLIDNMDSEQVRFLTIKALESSFSRGAFNLLESEIVSKLIRKISYQEKTDEIDTLDTK